MQTAYARRGTEILRFALIVFACAVMALDYRTFVEWGGLLPAGATGLSMLIQRILQAACDSSGVGVTVPFSPINIALNAVPVWIGIKYVGRKFTFLSVCVIVLTGVFADFMPVDALTSLLSEAEVARLKDDPFLASVFGGIIFGFGMALCLRADATTGGTDFIAIYLSEKKGRETWNLIFAVNAVILLCGGFSFGWKGVLYSIVFQFVTLQVVHLMYKTYQYQTLLIVTTRPQRICEAIYRISHHGATVIPAHGGFTEQNRSIVFSVVAADDTPRVYALCKSQDPQAFINTISTSRVIGRFYMRPRE